MIIEVPCRWLFADNLISATVEFVEQKPFRKGGNTMWFIGEIKYLEDSPDAPIEANWQGDLQCFPSAISNLKQLILLWGKDDKDWIGKRCSVLPTKDKKKLIFTPI